MSNYYGYVSVDGLLKYCANQKNKTIDANDIARYPKADVQEIRWIPVSERLPIYNTEWVLTYRPTMGVKMLVDRYEGHYGEDDDDDEWEEGWIYGGDTVAAWMPLPRPYEAT